MHVTTSIRIFQMMAGGTGLAAVAIWQGPFIFVQRVAVKVTLPLIIFKEGAENVFLWVADAYQILQQHLLHIIVL